MARPRLPANVFCSSACQDEPLRKKLETHLVSLKRQGLIAQLYNRDVVAGTEWAQIIDRRLDEASLILLLISPDFLASDYCYQHEVQRAMERHRENTAHVLPILLRPAVYEGTPFEHLQVLPVNARPITLWRNQDQGLLEVVKGIRCALEELADPQELMHSSAPALWSIPFRRNPYFLGQAHILERLHNRLIGEQANTFTPPLAITGLAGIGKTQIVLEYSYRHRTHYTAAFWVRADSRESLILDLIAIACLLQLPEKDAQDQHHTVEAVNHWLSTHTGWLLIVDNLEEVALLDTLLPLHSQGHILLTTRAQALGTHALKINVEQMEEEQGALLLLRRAHRLTVDEALDRADPSDLDAARGIIGELGGLPLAIDQAGAYIEETGCSVLDYQERYRKHHAFLLSRRGRQVSDHPEAVAITLSLSLQKIVGMNPEAVALLRFCAFLSPDCIPEEVIIAGASGLDPEDGVPMDDPIVLDETLAVLRSYSLVRRHPEAQTLSVHRLIQTVLKDDLTAEQQCFWIKQIARALDNVYPGAEFEHWSLCERYLLHARACIDAVEQWDILTTEAADLLFKTGCYFFERAHYNEAESLHRRALAMRERLLPADHLDLAHSLNYLGLLFLMKSDYVQAEALFRRALRIREQVLGAIHRDTAISLNNLALLFHKQGKYTQAETCYRAALESSKEPSNPQALDAGIAANLAGLYLCQGKYGEAEPLYQQILCVQEEALGVMHPRVAHTLQNLAGCLRLRGNYPQGVSLARRALLIQEQALGPTHPDVAASLDLLSIFCQEQSKFDEAEPLLQRALDIRKQIFGPDSLEATRTIRQIATLSAIQGKHLQAEQLLQRMLGIQERVEGPDHPEVAHTLHNLASLYANEGRYHEAKPLFQRALYIRQQTLEPNHPDLAASLDRLALLYLTLRQHDAAEPLFHRALRGREQALGPDHPDVAQSLSNLASLYQDQSKYHEAAVLAHKALQIRESKFGQTHALVAQSLNNLALLYYAQGNYREGEPLLQRALTIWEQVLGPDHPETATSLGNLALLYLALGREREAEPLFQRALRIREQAFGGQSPVVAISLNNLALLYHKQGKYDLAEPLYQRALRLQEDALGPHHPEVSRGLSNLAGLYLDQGKDHEAELLLQRARALWERKEETPNLVMASVFNQVATLYMKQGRYTEAELLFQRILSLREQLLGSNHGDVADSLNNLASLFIKQEQYELAEPLLQRALHIREQVLGSDHLAISQSLNNLATLYTKQGRLAQAEPLFQRALVLGEQALPANQPRVMILKKNYADFLQQRRCGEKEHSSTHREDRQA